MLEIINGSEICFLVCHSLSTEARNNSGGGGIYVCSTNLEKRH